MPLKILIADDHALLRQGLRLLLADANPEFEFAEAEGFDSALDVLAEGHVDLLLVDLGMPGMAGAESLRALREAHRATKVAVITGSDDRTTILECLGAGVHGYILKSSPMEEIQRAIGTILAGGVYVAPSLAQLGGDPAPAPSLAPEPFRQAAAEAPAEMPRFTSRQLDVLRLLAEGRSTKEIARALELGPGTVKIHLAAIFRALNAHNRTEAVVLASRLNL
ncbi:MAG: response regulator transcription factor [Acetobacteraceae bacterium]